MARNKSRNKGREALPTSPKSPVTLRLGDLEPAVEERAAGAALGSIVRRDLARYYRLIGDYHIQLALGVDAADVVVHALRGFDEAAYQYIWAAVDDFLASRDHVLEHLKGLPLHHRFRRVNREILTQMLRRDSSDYGQNMAMLDAVERYWSRLGAINLEPHRSWVNLPEGYDPDYPVTDAEIDTFLDVGLIYLEAAERYRQERDDPARLKTRPEQKLPSEEVRDAPAAAPKLTRKFALGEDV